MIWHQIGLILNHIHINPNQFHIAALIISQTFQNTIALPISSIQGNQSKILWFLILAILLCSVLLLNAQSRWVQHLSSSTRHRWQLPFFFWGEIKKKIHTEAQEEDLSTIHRHTQTPSSLPLSLSTIAVCCKNDRRGLKNDGDNIPYAPLQEV